MHFTLAITDFVNNNPVDKMKMAPRCHGNGAPAAADALVTDIKRYPVGTKYYNVVTRIEYTRIAIAGVTADFSATAAGTIQA